MAWISFSVVVLVFYAPCFGLGRQIAEQQIQLPISGLPNPIPFGGDLLLFVYSLALWAVLGTFLWLLETSGIFPLFKKEAFRNNFLYALLPKLSNSIAVFLAGLIFGRWVGATIFELLALLLKRFDLEQVIVQLLSSLVNGVIDFLGVLPIPSTPEIIVLSALILIVARVFLREQQQRNEAEIHQLLIRRKQRLLEMSAQDSR